MTIEKHRQHWAHNTQSEDINRNNTTQNTKMMSNTDPTNILGAREREPVPVSYMSLAMVLRVNMKGYKT